MDEAEKYQQRLQAIVEKRQLQEEEEKVRREMEEEWLKLAHHKRKSLREQWLMEVTPSSAVDPKLQSVIPTPQTTEQSAEETQSSERQMKKEEVEKTENMNEESTQIGKNELSIHSADKIEKPAQTYLGEEDGNVLEVLEVEMKRNLLSKAAHEDTAEKRKVKTEEQEVDQLAVDLLHHSLQHNKTADEAHGSLADRKIELSMAEDNAAVEEEEWEMVNCSPEEGLGLVLTSDLTQAQIDSGFGHKGDGTILKVEQVFIMDEEEDVGIGASEVLSLVVAEKKSDLEDTSCESPSERTQEERPPGGALQTLSYEKGAHAGTSAPLQELSNVSGINSPVYSVEYEWNLPHLPAHTTHAVEEILGDNTEYKGNQSISADRIVKVELKEALGPEDEVFQNISLDKKREKSSSLLQMEMVAQSTEHESEIQILMPPSVAPNRAETVTPTKRKTCHCCTVM
ncbi:uncharacterized protein LOC128599260 [Ictalurus furcatus]|uniref:uncharacterized protein LOC128599260 n=1 Tax=Ictalurus furcatus TaxID=66913 RepID=UPI002350725A|nr:uncharacterized protein LOC128599260 [Ictalurus furcatus]